jgi:endonuclease III
MSRDIIRKPWRGSADDIDTARLIIDIDQALARWSFYIWSELETIRGIPEHDRAYHALTFAIVSPRCRFAKNVAATPDLVRALQFGAPRGVLENILRQHGIGLAVQKSERLHAARPTLERFTPDRAMLLELRGVGPKVAAMALALYDDTLPVFTLDTHMLAGITREDVNIVSPARYRALESVALAACNDSRRLVAPYATPFAIQWALWCDYSGMGFQSHLPIFGRDVE